jgi:hypothetical protein
MMAWLESKPLDANDLWNWPLMRWSMERDSLSACLWAVDVAAIMIA